IHLLPSELRRSMRLIGQQKYYNCNFIRDCCRENMILNLNDYEVKVKEDKSDDESDDEDVRDVIDEMEEKEGKSEDNEMHIESDNKTEEEINTEKCSQGIVSDSEGTDIIENENTQEKS